ncbi:hypothetical protein F1880_007601 [Penicillium rolfsii]|nr:hypothetical protein F1880_007601 [Penicillium rolfsii]
MCFYNQKIYSCGDWDWTHFVARCTHSNQIGEICRIKLVSETEKIARDCPLCRKIEVTYRLMKAEIERQERWQKSDGDTTLAFIHTLGNIISNLQEKLSKLESDRETRRRVL